MAQIELAESREHISFGSDASVCPQLISDIAGGRSLDVDGYDIPNIKAGQIVIKKNGEYKPLAIKSGAYVSLPEGYKYAGIVYRSVETKNAAVSIMLAGKVNEAAAPYPFGEHKAAIKAEFPGIIFIEAEG